MNPRRLGLSNHELLTEAGRTALRRHFAFRALKAGREEDAATFDARPGARTSAPFPVENRHGARKTGKPTAHL
jgi:hypothetical protein